MLWLCFVVSFSCCPVAALHFDRQSKPEAGIVHPELRLGGAVVMIFGRCSGGKQTCVDPPVSNSFQHLSGKRQAFFAQIHAV
jgi:hypothetical protein